MGPDGAHWITPMGPDGAHWITPMGPDGAFVRFYMTSGGKLGIVRSPHNMKMKYF